MTDVRLVYATAPDLETARRLGRTLVEERRAACVNLLPGMESCYWWEGRLEEAREVVLLFKTVAARVDGLVARLVELHPYRTPCAVAFGVEAGLDRYLAWVAEETRK